MLSVCAVLLHHYGAFVHTYVYRVYFVCECVSFVSCLVCLVCVRCVCVLSVCALCVLVCALGALGTRAGTTLKAWAPNVRVWSLPCKT